jgi:membrane fusion protein, heavy metal efflux system
MMRALGLGRMVATAVLGMGLALAVLPASVSAHGGEEHNEVAEPVIGPAASPRASAQSDLFELVGVAHGQTLTIFLDRFADNAPVTDATIEVEVNGETLRAEPMADGSYRIAASWIATPGHHDLVITVLAGQQSDLLTAKLDVPEPVLSTAGPAAGLRAQMAVGGNSALNLAGAFLLGMATMGALVRMRSLAVPAGLGGADPLPAPAPLHGMRQPAGVAFAGLGRRARRARYGFLRIAANAGASLAAAVSYAGGHLATVPQTVLVAARSGARRLSSLTLLSIGFLVLALFLLFVERAVFAQGTSDKPAAAPAQAAKPMAASAAPAMGAGNGPRRLLDGTVFVPKASQRLLNVRTAVAQPGETGRTMRIAGHVIADPGTSGQIHSSIKGRIVPEGSTWPRIGQKVAAGEVLAWIVPIINPIDRGIIFQQLAQIDHEVAQTQERVQRLAAQGANASAEELDTARGDLANLSRRRAAIATVLRDRDTLRAPLFAPADGVIAASFAVAGQLVDEQQKLFEVVDPKRLWIEAYAYDITALGDVTSADALSSVGGSYKLKFISRGPQLQKQTIPLYFHIENPDGRLSVGSVVSVLMQTSDRRRGMLVPREAVVRDTAGQSIVWHHTQAESFVPLPVRVEAVDGDQVLVIAGLKPNTRIVVESADLLNEIR